MLNENFGYNGYTSEITNIRGAFLLFNQFERDLIGAYKADQIDWSTAMSMRVTKLTVKEISGGQYALELHVRSQNWNIYHKDIVFKHIWDPSVGIMVFDAKTKDWQLIQNVYDLSSDDIVSEYRLFTSLIADDYDDFVKARNKISDSVVKYCNNCFANEIADKLDDLYIQKHR